MKDRITQTQFRDLTTTWTMNNGIDGFIDYFFYPHKRSAFYDTPKEMLTAYHNKDSSKPHQWSEDYYVNEWWGCWLKGLATVYNKSDGSILHWLYHCMEREEARSLQEDEAIGLAAQADEEQRDYMDRHRDLVE